MIRFSCELRSHGWARATINGEHSEVTVTASYLSDALGDFISAVEGLFRAEHSECVWEEEPGEFRWKFRREGPRCIVEVLRNDENAPLFLGEDRLLHFGAEVSSAFQELLEKWGAQGYLEKWGHPFPEKAHRDVARLIEREERT